GLGVTSRPSRSREPAAQALAALLTLHAGVGASDAPSRTLDRAFSAHSSRMMDHCRTDYRRTTSSRLRLVGSKKLRTRRPPADPARTICIVGRWPEGAWVMKVKLTVAALVVFLPT